MRAKLQTRKLQKFGLVFLLLVPRRQKVLRPKKSRRAKPFFLCIYFWVGFSSDEHSEVDIEHSCVKHLLSPQLLSLQPPTLSLF